LKDLQENESLEVYEQGRKEEKHIRKAKKHRLQA
jgi:hypothetical protein